MTVAVYGASGSLGRLVLPRLIALGATPVRVVRSSDAAAQLREAEPGARVEVAALEDAGALARAFRGSDVVVNCAPAEACGDLIARAAMRAGADYVDAAGEQHHIRRVFDTLEDEARKAGRLVVPALGFDYAVGDCLARLAARAHEPAAEIVVAYCIEGAEVSGNSAQAAGSTTPGREMVYRNGAWRPVPLELDRGWFDFPASIGRRRMSRYGSGEVITVPRHTSTETVRTLITSEALCPHPALLPVFPVLRPLVTVILRTPARHLLRLAARVVASSRTPADPEAIPSRLEQQNRFVVAVEARGRDGSIGRAAATGGDFHAVTAAILAQGAVWLGGSHRNPGVRSPAAAFDPAELLNALATEGVTWSCS